MGAINRRATCFAFLAMLAASGLVSAQQPKTGSGLYTIKVVVDGFQNKDGMAVFALFASEDGYDKAKPVQQKRVPITARTLTYEFTGLKPGEYAVQVVHDLDGNNVPKWIWYKFKVDEGVGLSNNYYAGRPKWKYIKFTLENRNAEIKILMNYM